MNGANFKYNCKVFLKNIKIQQEIVIDNDTQIVQSFQGFTCYDSATYMVNYLETVTAEKSNFDVKKLANDYSEKMPVCVIKLWNIKASNLAEATQLALKKSKPIIKFLTYNQCQSPQTFGVTASRTEEGSYLSVLPVTFCRWKFHIMDDLNKSARYISTRIEKDEKFDLYITLFSEAVSEDNLDFKIVKLWTILETMAFSFKGGKEQKVRAMLGDYQIGIQQYENYDLIKLVYKHRNAIIHEGTTDPNLASSEYSMYLTESTKNLKKIINDLQELINFLIRLYIRRTV